MRRLKYGLGKAELCRDQSNWRTETAYQGSGNGIPSGALSSSVGSQFTKRAAAGSASHHEGRRTWANVRFGNDYGSGSDSRVSRRLVRSRHTAFRPDAAVRD